MEFRKILYRLEEVRGERGGDGGTGEVDEGGEFVEEVGEGFGVDEFAFGASDAEGEEGGAESGRE